MFSITISNQSNTIKDSFEWSDDPKFNIFDETDIINKFQSHPNIVKAKQKFSFKWKFAFKLVTEEFVKNIVNDLSRSKAAGGDIPLNLLKKESNFVLPYLVHCANEALLKNYLIPWNCGI